MDISTGPLFNGIALPPEVTDRSWPFCLSNVTSVPAAEKYQACCVRKDSVTVTAEEGREQYYINTSGSSALATAGSGDVLAGIIGAFLAQGMAPEQAAAGGVYLHGLAGDRCAERLSQIGMTAPDLIEELPALFLELTATK